MCQIITYGFTINGTLANNVTCSANPTDILGVEIQVLFDFTEVGKTVIATVDLSRDGTRINTKPLVSQQYTVPYTDAINIFKISFSGISTTIPGLYTLPLGTSIHSPNFSSQYCYAETSTRCTAVTVINPPSCISVTITHRNWSDPNNAVIGYYSSIIDGHYAQGDQAWGWGGMGTPTDQEYRDTVAIPQTLSYLGGNWYNVYGTTMTIYNICGEVPPLKWNCSGSPDYICTESTDGVYYTKEDCIAACKSDLSDSGSSLLLFGTGLGLAVIYFLSKGK